MLALDGLPDAVVERLRAVDGGVGGIGVRGAVPGGLLVVPAGQVVLVDHLRVLGERDVGGRVDVRVVAGPFELRADGQGGVEVRLALGVVARIEVRDVLVVRVEPVERVADLGHGVLEVLRRVDLVRVVEVGIKNGRVRYRHVVGEFHQQVNNFSGSRHRGCGWKLQRSPGRDGVHNQRRRALSIGRPGLVARHATGNGNRLSEIIRGHRFLTVHL